MRDQQPVQLHQILTANYFEENCYPGVGYFFDSSKTKIGRQSLPNRLLFMRTIKQPWNLQSNKLSDDKIRILMKKAFFPQYLYQI